MMKRLRATLAVSTLCLLVFPVASYAHVGWWDWLGELSGPGPFHHRGQTYDWRVLCRVQRTSLKGGGVWAADGKKLARNPDMFAGQAPSVKLGRQLVGQVLPCSSTPGYTDRASGDRVSDYVEVRYGSVRSGDQQVFQDDDSSVGIVTARHVQATVFHQFERLRGVSLGAGAGLIWFKGKPLDRSPARLTITPIAIAIKPIEIFKQIPGSDLVILRIEATRIIGGMKATDFVTTSTSSFSSKSETKATLSVMFNLAAMLR
jgi:hypothetical protein